MNNIIEMKNITALRKVSCTVHLLNGETFQVADEPATVTRCVQELALEFLDNTNLADKTGITDVDFHQSLVKNIGQQVFLVDEVTNTYYNVDTIFKIDNFSVSEFFAISHSE